MNWECLKDHMDLVEIYSGVGWTVHLPRGTIGA